MLNGPSAPLPLAAAAPARSPARSTSDAHGTLTNAGKRHGRGTKTWPNGDKVRTRACAGNSGALPHSLTPPEMLDTSHVATWTAWHPSPGAVRGRVAVRQEGRQRHAHRGRCLL
ncbi:MAG: hypothetical protein ACPIOQ_53625 [Promethearchaeia archaeon]